MPSAHGFFFVKNKWISSTNSTNKRSQHFRTISRDMYLCKLTSALQDQTANDPLAQPVNVCNNIEHGYGFFGGYSRVIIGLRK